MEATATAAGADDRRGLAIKQLQRKRSFFTHLTVYLAVNATLVVLWAAMVLGGIAEQGRVFVTPEVSVSAVFFWPIFPIVGWGFGLLMHGYSTFRGNVFSERQIRREMEKLG